VDDIAFVRGIGGVKMDWSCVSRSASILRIYCYLYLNLYGTVSKLSLVFCSRSFRKDWNNGIQHRDT